MQNVLLTGQLIWDALQAESGDFDVLWEVLQSQRIQGYITQNDLDILYRQIAQEQDVNIAFGLVSQLQKVLLIYSPSRSQLIDIEVNDSSHYSYSVAVESSEAHVLSLEGFLERYALDMLYFNDSLSEEGDRDINIGVQQWYRKWRRSAGFDTLWLFPILVTLALQSMPFFQKMVAELIDRSEGELPTPKVAQGTRPSESALPTDDRSATPLRNLPDGATSQSSPKTLDREHQDWVPFSERSEPRSELNSESPIAKSSPLRQSTPSLPLSPSSSIRPPSFTPTPPSTILILPSLTPIIPRTPQPTSPPKTSPGSEQPTQPQVLIVPLLPSIPTPTTDPGQGAEFPDPVPPQPIDPIVTEPSLPPLPTFSPPDPTDRPQVDVDIAGDGVMQIPDPLIDPSSIADPAPSAPSQDFVPPDDSSQSSLPQVTPGTWGSLDLGYGELGYQQDYSIDPEDFSLGGIGTLPVETNLFEPAPSIGTVPELALNFRL